MNQFKSNLAKTIFHYFLCGSVIATIGAFLLRQLYDPDLWWHLVIGSEIVRTFTIPTTDHFAAAALGNPYHDSHWFFQVVLALVHHVSGMNGVGIAGMGIWAGALFFTYRSTKIWVCPEIACITLLMVALAGEERFIPRPEIVTFLMIGYYYWFLQGKKYSSRSGMVCLAVAQIVWTNSHGLFVIGPFMVGCYWLVSVCRQMRNRQQQDDSLHVPMMVVLVCMLVSPHDLSGIRYAFILLSEVGPGAPTAMKLVGELQPTFSSASLSGIGFWLFLVLFLSALAMSTLNMAQRREMVSWERLLICVGMAFAAISAYRNIPLFALVAGPFISEQINLSLGGRFKVPPLMTGVATVVILAIGILPVSNAYYASKTPTQFGLGVAPFWYPLGLPAFLKESGFRGQVFNSASLGGFYLYYSFPERIPFYDGRWEIYGEETLGKIRHVVENASIDRAVWEEFLKSNRIEALLLQHLSPEAEALLPLLPNDLCWRLAYFDNAASFWVRGDCIGTLSMDLAGTSHVAPYVRRDNWEMLDWFLQVVNAPDDVRRYYMQQVPALLR